MTVFEGIISNADDGDDFTTEIFDFSIEELLKLFKKLNEAKLMETF